MEKKHEFGIKSEEFAANYLCSQGYTILHRNWRYDHKELDIVCTDGKSLVVVEVKGRNQNTFLPPEDLLNPRQERFILEASEEYLYKYDVKLPVRFDLIAVIQKQSGMDLEHIRDAIVPWIE